MLQRPLSQCREMCLIKVCISKSIIKFQEDIFNFHEVKYIGYIITYVRKQHIILCTVADPGLELGGVGWRS